MNMQTDAAAKALADDMSRFVNRHPTGFGDIATEMAKDHPTLQQAKMRLFVAFVREMAKKTYTDARNEASVKLAQQLVEQWGDFGPSLPFI